jgi:membrane protein DedA with SNARE-associated domain
MNSSSIIDGLLKTIERFAETYPILSYIILFLSAIIENIFPPIPGDTVTVFGAFLVGRGKLDYLLVLISTTLGSTVGFMGLFYIGYYFGRDYFTKKNFKFFPVTMINKTSKWFVKYGYLIILFNRFLAAIRSVISLTAGMAKMPHLTVWILTFIGCAVWNGLLIYAGYYLGENWSDVDYYLKQYSLIILGIIIFIVLLVVIKRWRRKKTA